jgi:TRAP-type C4-dicarboxylate transport system permease small subunit
VKRILNNIPEIVSGIALLIVILGVCYGVISRYAFNRSATWANELATITFTWVVFLGASAAFKRKLHIGIDLLVKSVPPTLRTGLEILANMIILVFIGYMTVMGVIFSLQAYKQPTSVLRIPNTYVYLAVPVGFGLMLVYELAYLIKRRKQGFVREE